MKCSIVDIHTHRPTGKALEPSFAGIHPWQAETRRIEEIVPRFGEVDLVGEIGLDYYWAENPPKERQMELFRQQVLLAKELGLPENEEVLMILDLGYAAEGTGPLANHGSRKPLSATVAYL